MAFDYKKECAAKGRVKGWNPDAVRAFSTVPLFWNKAGGLPCQCGRARPPLAARPGSHEIALAAGLPS